MELAVNLSARQLAQPDLVEMVATALGASGLEPNRLCLEITETVLMEDVTASVVVLRALKHLGVTLAIDDFGTGYSSLAYLKRLPVDVVKIDRSLLDGVGTVPRETAIVGAVISLAHAFDLRVIAEGVESREQVNELRLVGCDLAQGWFYGRACGPESFRALLMPAPLVADAS